MRTDNMVVSVPPQRSTLTPFRRTLISIGAAFHGQSRRVEGTHSPLPTRNNPYPYDIISYDIIGAIHWYGPYRETLHVGHHQPDDHHRQGVLSDPDDPQHGGGRESVQQHRHYGEGRAIYFFNQSQSFPSIFRLDPL